MSEKVKVNALQVIALLAVFALTHFGVQFLVTSVFGLEYASPMWEWISLPAFFMAYFAPSFLDPEKKTFLHKPLSIPVIFLLGLIGFQLATYFFYYNVATNSGLSVPNNPVQGRPEFQAPNNPWAMLTSNDYCYTLIGEDYSLTQAGTSDCRGVLGGNAFIVVLFAATIALIYKQLESIIIK